MSNKDRKPENKPKVPTPPKNTKERSEETGQKYSKTSN